MKLLIIDTCGNTGSVALANTALDPPVAAAGILPGRTASEHLVGTITRLTGDAGIPLRSLDAIVVVHGPGSFTGVRVGLSAAKGLCEALNLPLIAISRLAVLANNAAPPAGTRVFALLDAGRGEFYLGAYADGVCLREALLSREQVTAAIMAPESAESSCSFVTCETSIVESLFELLPHLIAEPTAADVLPLALHRLQDKAFDDPATLDANYLRRTDAEIFAKAAVVQSAQQPMQQSLRTRA